LNLLNDRAPDSRRVLNEVRVVKDNLIYSDSLRGLLDEFQGYPIAITTAAPHLRQLSVPELLDRIKQRGIAVFEDPAIRNPVELTRMRSLAVSLGLSVQRLKEDGAAEALSLFGVLSLFPAGLTKSVLTRLELADWEKKLWRLRDYSMAEYDEEDQRYYLLAPMRRFAQNYLDKVTRRTVAARAIIIFAAIARELYNHWPNLGAGATAKLLARDEPNFLAVIDLGRNVEAEPQALAGTLTIAAALIRLYTLLDRLRAGSRLSDRIVSDSYWQTDPAGLAYVRYAAGDLAVRRDQLESAETHYQAAETLYQGIDDSLGLANTLRARGDLAVRRDQLESAETHYQAAETLYQGIDYSLGLANTLQARGDLAVRAASWSQRRRTTRRRKPSTGVSTLRWGWPTR